VQQRTRVRFPYGNQPSLAINPVWQPIPISLTALAYHGTVPSDSFQKKSNIRRKKMASQTNKPEGKETPKGEPKPKNKKGIRNPLLYAGTILLLVIVIVAFVFIPSMGSSSAGSIPDFGSWNGKPIQYRPDSYFADQVSQINEYLRQQGLPEENFQMYAYQVWRIAFQSTAIRTALIDTVARSGFRVTEKGLDEAMTQLAQFQDNGKFSLEKYNQTPKATLLSLRNSTRDDLYVRRYYEDLYSVAPSTAEIQFVADMAKPQRTIVYTSIPLSDFPDSEVVAWGKSNSDLFRTIGISRITITSSESDAKKILKQVQDNKLSFEDAAKSHSKDAYADKGGDAGTVIYYTFEEGFSNKADAAKVAALKKDEISDVYKLGENAWAFFKINSEIAEPDFTNPTTINEVRSYIKEKEKGTMESWAMAKATSLITSTKADDFKKIVQNAKLPLKEAGPMFINLNTPTFYAYGQQIPLLQGMWTNNDPALADAESSESFMTQVFSLPLNTISKPLVVGDYVVVFFVKEEKQATDDDVAMTKFAYPYFQQQALDTQTRDTILKSKKLKDDFNKAFLALYKVGGTASSAATTQQSQNQSTQESSQDTQQEQTTTTTQEPEKK